MADEIIAEVWRNKDKMAAEQDFNLEALVKRLQGVRLNSGNLVGPAERKATEQGAAADGPKATPSGRG